MATSMLAPAPSIADRAGGTGPPQRESPRPAATGARAIGSGLTGGNHTETEAPAPLAAEFQHLARYQQRRRIIEILARCGVAIEQALIAGVREAAPLWPVGLTRAERLPGGHWAPDEGGAESLILPAMDRGEIADLIAVVPAAPRRPLTRYGWAWCLGIDQLDDVRWQQDDHDAGWMVPPPLLIGDDPLEWLRAGGAGLCVIDWRRAALHLADLKMIAAATHAVADRLAAAFRRAVPRIVLREDAA